MGNRQLCSSCLLEEITLCPAFWVLAWVLLNVCLSLAVTGEQLEGVNRVLKSTDNGGPTDK